MEKKEKSLFWVSYADLMTSLFFVMLVLLIGVVVVLSVQSKDRPSLSEMTKLLDEKNKEIELLKEQNKKVNSKLKISEQNMKALQEINDATKNIDPTYFEYVEEYKKHKLNIEVNFEINDAEIENLSLEKQDSLLMAGESLRKFIEKTTKENKGIQYLLIIEGQASIYGTEENNYPLSYRRAYGLKKFWEENGISFSADNCEVLICGSGDGRQSGTGLMREQDERLNQRFLIHILPKPGHIDVDD